MKNFTKLLFIVLTCPSLARECFACHEELYSLSMLVL